MKTLITAVILAAVSTGVMAETAFVTISDIHVSGYEITTDNASCIGMLNAEVQDLLGHGFEIDTRYGADSIVMVDIGTMGIVQMYCNDL